MPATFLDRFRTPHQTPRTPTTHAHTTSAHSQPAQSQAATTQTNCQSPTPAQTMAPQNQLELATLASIHEMHRTTPSATAHVPVRAIARTIPTALRLPLLAQQLAPPTPHTTHYASTTLCRTQRHIQRRKDLVLQHSLMHRERPRHHMIIDSQSHRVTPCRNRHWPKIESKRNAKHTARRRII